MGKKFELATLDDQDLAGVRGGCGQFGPGGFGGGLFGDSYGEGSSYMVDQSAVGEGGLLGIGGVNLDLLNGGLL